MEHVERERLAEAESHVKHWRRWGPYLSERQWGTVREDYSPDGNPWQYLPYDKAPFYAYRWGEDGIAGICDNHQRLCFAIALWNGQDPMLKERLFGLDNTEGNHGEDVKEYYWHLDCTPTHSYMRYLYRYPQNAFPYQQLREENARRGRRQPEYELADTGILDENRFFDVEVEYAKADANDLLIRITARNAGPEAAVLHLLPTLWFRNSWRWCKNSNVPRIEKAGLQGVRAEHAQLGTVFLDAAHGPRWMFTGNETNLEQLYGAPNACGLVKDGFHQRIIHGAEEAVSEEAGTKCAAWYVWKLEPDERRSTTLRLREYDAEASVEGADFDQVFDARKAEAEAFYGGIVPSSLPVERRAIARQAFDGVLWSKQWYHFIVEQWLAGDPTMPPPDPKRAHIRNEEWLHVYNDDVLSMPDKWEFPWFAVWDSAFHAVTLAEVDADYAKQQLRVFTREWYMHPNGQLPAYEWDFSDVNPPVHAWATWRVYSMERERTGHGDTQFLESVFHKLLMNFTWWVNRKDTDGDNIFQGGFLGMDNIGVFDWSAHMPIEGRIEQSDCTSWMAMYCLNMLRIAWELSKSDPVYEDIASKFFEHFLYIASAIYNIEGTGASLWDEKDGFFYDQIQLPDGRREHLRIRSMVGLIPLLAVEMVDHGQMKRLPGFARRMNWFYDNRSDLTKNITCVFGPEHEGRCILSLLNQEQLKRVLALMLDENEFLSDYGIRSLSKAHDAEPFVFQLDHYRSVVQYLPAESDSALFGGNSNWRGPVWLPVNFLLIDALRRYHTFWGDGFQVEFPTGSGHLMHLNQVADALAERLIALFERRGGRRPALGDRTLFQEDPAWKDLPAFYEYFHGDTGAGLGASHQTGWTALVANLILEQGR